MIPQLPIASMLILENHLNKYHFCHFFFLWTISREIHQINGQKHSLKYEREVKYNMVKKEEEHT